MRKRPFVLGAMFAALIGSTAGSQEIPRECFERGLSTMAASNPGLLPRAQIALEKRRVGGPRGEVLARLLARDRASKDPEWLTWVLEECKGGRVRCAEYVDLARDETETAKPYYKPRAQHRLELFAVEAEWQALTGKQKRACIERALSADLCLAVQTGLRSEDAANRALDEGYTDLVPQIQKAELTWPQYNWLYISCRIEVLQARGSVSPEKVLLKLVDEAVSYDAKVATSLDPNELPIKVENRIGFLAPLALAELRLLGPPGVAEALKRIMLKYERVRQLANPKGAAVDPSQFTKRERPFPPNLGRLGERIAEAIGDFGDRDFERLVLGGSCLFDQVSQTEKEFVAKGLISAEDTVAGQ